MVAREGEATCAACGHVKIEHYCRSLQCLAEGCGCREFVDRAERNPPVSIEEHVSMDGVIDNAFVRKAKSEILLYLIGVAEKTGGSEVWRALFAEILSNLNKGAVPQSEGKV